MRHLETKTRILYLVSTLERKGPTNQLLYITSYLDKTKFEVLILTLSKESSHSMKSDFERKGIKVVSLNTGRIKGVFINRRRIRAIVKGYKPHLIHSQGIRADGYNAVFKNICKVVTTARNVPDYDYPNKFGRVKGALMAVRHIEVFKKLNVIACSEAISKEYVRLGIPTIPIQNGVDIQKFSPVSGKERQALKEEAGLSGFDNIFITIGSLIPRKNLQVLINAFNNKADNDALLIVGDGPEKNRLSEMVISKNIIFHDFTSNITDLLRLSDCYISASLSEGLPNAVMEAMASGVPVILSNIDSHIELIKGSELFKFLFNSVEYEDAIAKINLFKGCNVADLADKSRQIAVELFSAQNMSKKYQQLYINLINNNVFQI